MTDKFSIRPHPKAPNMSNESDAQEIITQLVTQFESKTFSLSAKDVRMYLRETGFVSLWFFLKVICGYSGPYQKMDEGLDLDVCNFRQSDSCMAPGARAGAVLFRGAGKSTKMTHGGATWDLLRNPDERILIAHLKEERSLEFMWTIQANFCNNPLVKALYPEYVPASNQERVNKKEFTLPNRSRYFVEPSVKAIGIGGSGEGGHYTTLFPDDIAGLESIDEIGLPAAEMRRAERWFSVNSNALLEEPDNDRIIACFTVFSGEGVYDRIIDNIKTVYGFQEGPFQPGGNREWDLYYRDTVENGKATKPSVMSKARYEKVLKEDPWVAMTQYSNRKMSVHENPLEKYPMKSCEFGYDRDNYPAILLPENEEVIKLSDCTGVGSIDFAGTRDKITAATSETSIGITFRDDRGRAFRVWGVNGYFGIRQIMKYLFEANDLFFEYIDGFVAESNALQGSIADLIEEENEDRLSEGKIKYPIVLLKKPATDDKLERIRATWQWYLSQGKFYVVDGIRSELEKQRLSFNPMKDKKRQKLDILDEGEKALRYLRKPPTREQKVEAAIMEYEMEFADEDSAF